MQFLFGNNENVPLELLEYSRFRSKDYVPKYDSSGRNLMPK